MSVKPLARWAIFQGWTLRYTRRSRDVVEGVFSTDSERIPFRYRKDARTIHLPDRTVHLNEHGWEVDEMGQTHFQSKSRPPVSNEQHTHDDS